MEALAAIGFVLVFVAIIGLPIYLAASTVRRNRAPLDPARGAALARLAAERGWSHTSRDDTYMRRFRGYPFGRGGHLRPAFDLVRGTHRGRAFACFLFAPPRSLQPGEQVLAMRYLRVFLISLPFSAPRVLVTEARGAPRWTRRYKVGDEAFDRAFAIGTDDEAFADRILTESVRRWLLETRSAVPLRLGGEDLISWRIDAGDFAAEMLEPALDRLCDFLDRLPADRVHRD